MEPVVFGTHTGKWIYTTKGASDCIFHGSYFGEGCCCMQTPFHLRLHSYSVVENKGPDKPRCLQGIPNHPSRVLTWTVAKHGFPPSFLNFFFKLLRPGYSVGNLIHLFLILSHLTY